MNVNLEYYKVFYHVARLGSITLATDELFISQPAISQAIKHLELSLGSSLFFRTPKGVKLTPEGKVLYSYIAQGYEYIMLGESKFKEMLDLESGEIRIGASDMTLQFYLLPYLEEFHRLYPKIKVKVTNAPTPDTIEYLEAGKIDFGIVSSSTLTKQKFCVTPVCKIQDVFVAGSHFEHLKSKEIEMKALINLPIICLEQNTSTRHFVDEFLKTEGATLSPEFELATSDLIVQFAARNLGVGCVVRNFAEKYILDGSLFEVKLKNPIPPRDICIITYEKMPTSPAGKRLLQMLI